MQYCSLRKERMCYACELGTSPSLMRFAGFSRSRRGMRKVSEYRQHTKECRGLANQSRSPEHRQMLLNIAATWESLVNDRMLANDRIKTAEGLERAKLEKTARKGPQASEYAC